MVVSRSAIGWAYAAFCLTLMGVLATPLVLADRIEPRVFGLPFALWWTALGVVVSFGVLVALHLALGGEEPDP